MKTQPTNYAEFFWILENQVLKMASSGLASWSWQIFLIFGIPSSLLLQSSFAAANCLSYLGFFYMIMRTIQALPAVGFLRTALGRAGRGERRSHGGRRWRWGPSSNRNKTLQRQFFASLGQDVPWTGCCAQRSSERARRDVAEAAFRKPGRFAGQVLRNAW